MHAGADRDCTLAIYAVVFGLFAVSALLSVNLIALGIYTAALIGFSIWALSQAGRAAPVPAAIGSIVGTLLAAASLYLEIIGRDSNIPWAWLIPIVVLGGLTLSVAHATKSQPS